MIDETAIVLKQFLQDSRNIISLKQEFSGPWTKVSEEVLSYEMEALAPNVYQVICSIGYNYESSSTMSYVTVGYKLAVSNKDGEFKVLAASSSGLGAGILLDTIFTQAKDLDLTPFLSSSYSATALPYDYETIVARITQTHAEMTSASFQASSIPNEHLFQDC